MHMVHVIPIKRTLTFSPSGMRATKLCSNKILHFLTGEGQLTQLVVLYSGHKTVVVVVVVVVKGRIYTSLAFMYMLSTTQHKHIRIYTVDVVDDLRGCATVCLQAPSWLPIISRYLLQMKCTAGSRRSILGLHW